MADLAILPLELRQVVFAVNGRNLIDRISLRLEPGVRTVVIGPNGAGKSLLMRLCHGLLRPTSGEVIWHGPSSSEARHHQAMVFQRPVMLRRSVAANVDYALKLRKRPRPERRRKVEEALDRTGLSALAERAARVLSGGEQQRLALARAWALEPEVLFLDEPTANLDPAASRSVEQTIAAIHGSGAKIVMTTHDLGQARRLADEVLFLHRGRLVESSPAEEFFAAPKTPEAAAFCRGDIVD